MIQKSSYISGAIPLTNKCYISYEGQYLSVLDNIHIEGSVSQNFDIVPSFICMQKNGKISFFSSLFFYIS